MSEGIIKAILSELGVIANKHKLIIFDLDKTLIAESSIEVIAKEFGFYDDLAELREKFAKGLIRDQEITLSLAKMLDGKSEGEVRNLCARMHVQKNAEKVMERLRRRRYELAIVSLAFSPVVEFFAEKLGIDKNNIVCPQLVLGKDGRFNGEVIAKTRYNADCCGAIICKSDAAGELMKKLEVKPEECVAVGDGKNDACIFKACGLSLAYKPKTKIGDIKITNLAEVLIYAA
jgi:phosphoserine phosphatase